MTEKVKKTKSKKNKVEDSDKTILVMEIPLDIGKRERRVDINLLPAEQWAEISKELGKRCSEILNKAKDDCDKLLGIYGLKLKPSAMIVPLDYPETQE